MNSLIIRIDKKVFFDNVEYENVKWSIDGNLLLFEGDKIIKDCDWEEITDEETLNKIEPEYIETKKTFWKKRLVRYVPAWRRYTLIRRIHCIITSNSFEIIDKSQIAK